MEKELTKGHCPKCDREVVTKERAVLHGPRGIWSIRGNEVYTYICQGCGFMEFYFKKETYWKI